jgi:hypothetical protein
MNRDLKQEIERQAISAAMTAENSAVKRAVHITLQTLGSISRGAQLNLFNSADMVDSSGLMLEGHEGGIFNGMIDLLSDSGINEVDGLYNGTTRLINQKTGEVDAFVIHTSEPNLMDLSGILRGKNGKFTSNQRKQFKKALGSFMTKRRVIAYDYKEGKESGRVTFDNSLGTYTRITKEAYQGGKPKHSETYYEIRLDKIVAHQLKTFSHYQEPMLAQNIANAKKSLGLHRGPVTNFGLLLIGYLSTLNGRTAFNAEINDIKFHKINRKKLIVKLRVGHLDTSGHRGRADKAIEKAIAIAENLEYLLDGSNAAGDFYYLRLNMDKFSRINAAGKGQR